MGAMKILVGYDGSPHADAVLADLGRAGLPGNVEAVVLSVAEQWMPAPASLGGVTTSFPQLESEAEDKALKLARTAKAALNILFPDWQVYAEAATGSPGNLLIGKADEWKSDLIVVGAQGRSALGRLFFGSVSQKALHQAGRSVRIARAARKTPHAPVRLIVGVDGGRIRTRRCARSPSVSGRKEARLASCAACGFRRPSRRNRWPLRSRNGSPASRPGRRKPLKQRSTNSRGSGWRPPPS